MAGTMDMVIAAGVESMTRVPMGLSVGLPRQGRPRRAAMSPRQAARYPDIDVQPVHRRRDDGEEVRLHQGGARRVRLPQPAKGDRGDPAPAPSPAEIVAARDHPRGRRPRAAHRRRGHPLRRRPRRASPPSSCLPGTAGITAATASQICDGASGVMVVNERGLKALGVEPLARMHSMTVSGGDPVIMLEEPLFWPPTRPLRRAGMKIDDIDLYEVNEAFAARAAGVAARHTGADPARLNVNGGAIALGHPLGASGTKLMTTLIHALAGPRQALRPADHVRGRRPRQRHHRRATRNQCSSTTPSQRRRHRRRLGPGRGHRPRARRARRQGRDLRPQRRARAKPWPRSIGGVFCAVNVTADDSVDAAFAKARAAHGQERILVNCAGTGNAVKTASRDKATGEHQTLSARRLRHASSRST